MSRAVTSKAKGFFIMNYKRIYDCIVERGRNRELDGYKEKHHIVPRCLGGSNDADNLVELTAKEHFICHKLLIEMHPGVDKLVWGFWMMAKVKGRGQERVYKVGVREYERLRIEYSRVLKKRIPWNKGLTKDDPRVAKYSTTPRWNKGKTKSTDTKVAEHASKAHVKLKGKKRPDHSAFMKKHHQKRKDSC